MNDPATILQQIQTQLDRLKRQPFQLPEMQREAILADIARWQAILHNTPARSGSLEEPQEVPQPDDNKPEQIPPEHGYQEALQPGESRFRTLAQAAFEGITIGRNGILIEANEQFAQMHGYRLHEVIGRPITDFLIPEDRERVMRAILSGDERVSEYIGLRKDGSTFHLEARGRTIMMNGVPLRVSVLRDITERKQAELAILQSRKEMRQILESIHDGFFAFDREWRYIYINRKAAEPLGYEPEELIGKNLWDLFPKMRGTIAEMHYRRAMEEQVPSRYRVQGVYSGRWYDINVYPSPDGISVFTVDRTKQVLAEQALRESERRLKVALNSVPLQIYTIDADLRLTWVHETFYGIPAETAVGKRVDELLPPDAASGFTGALSEVLRTGHGLQQEIKIEPPSEEASYFLLTLDPIKNADDHVAGVTAASVDITQLRRLEAQQVEHLTHLEVQQRLLEYREKERQDIARDLHDGPVQDLSSLIFNIQFAKEAFHDPAVKLEFDQIGSTLRETVRDLRGMINELRPPSLIRFGLARAIQFHADDMAEKRGNLTIHLNLVEDGLRLPEQTRLGLFRIYQESLNNVIRHAQADSVWVYLGIEGEEMVLEVRDNGRGFVANPDLTMQTMDGHFGMAGMKERAEAIGGIFTLTSQPGQGTTVCVRCPLA